ncbi:hypothetical protein A9G11_02170 [Gilliamella sp. wkB108]|uniref:RnfABCDGE type electron transport complex subunit B n=1 Tax=Gilliamella sp. wkB108 TaxID=3120256 RepID=UPI00080DD53E|nr:RnfABCDGE type electron transport complex subunit B [Gilliamella apicola]OCG25453.1 hypothetical protein A9G11_02170 [Gilliamella apicola]
MQEVIMQNEQQYKAYIDEENCIGCGKCIRVCPTDAIVGSKQVLHTILPQFCTSCSNCINTCPTDCITLSTLGLALSKNEELQLTEKKQQRLSHNQLVPPTILFPGTMSMTHTHSNTLKDRKQSVADAIARVKAKKNLAVASSAPDVTNSHANTLEDRKQSVADAIARVKAKKNLAVASSAPDVTTSHTNTLEDRKQSVADAIARVKAKKNLPVASSAPDVTNSHANTLEDHKQSVADAIARVKAKKNLAN